MKHIIYSQTNDPTKWANLDYDVIQFATAEDAKKAETMFNALLKELDALRLLAAEPHYIDKVKAAMGPLSLWSADALEREIQRRIIESKRGDIDGEGR